MTKPIIKIHDTTTDKIIEREMTDDEIAEAKAAQAQAAQTQAKAEAKAAQRASILERLGLTEEEAALLLS